MRPTGEPWRPLLDGALADRARDALHRIRKSLSDLPVGYPQAEVRGDSLLDTGRLGQALFWAELARAGEDPEAAERAEACLDAAIDEIASYPIPPGLFAGFFGAGWVATHLDSVLGDTQNEETADAPETDAPETAAPETADDDLDAEDLDDEDLVEELDTALLAVLQQPGAGQAPNLLAGLVGYGVYALERLPRPRAAEALGRIVDILETRAEEIGPGLSWRTPPEALFEDARAAYPDGFYNLGLGHGLAGVIALLARIHATGIERGRAGHLLGGAMAWLSPLLADAGEAGSPQLVLAGTEPRVIRFAQAELSWCYGTPGVAAAVAFAGHALGRDWWIRLAVGSARRAAAVPLSEGEELGLCHGLAGTAHTFHRLYRSTGEAACADAARRAFAELLEHQRPGDGGSGFAVDPASPHAGSRVGGEKREWGGLLRGATGIGLVLHGALASTAPRWDRLLLLDQPAPDPSESPKASASS